MKRDPGTDGIGLRQLGVPTGSACVEFAFASRDLRAGLAQRSVELASVHRWRRDAVPAAAWALVLDRLLGAPDLPFHEIRESGGRWQAALPVPVEGMTAWAWIAAIERARDAALPAPDGVETDEAWLCGAPESQATPAAFAVGFEPGVPPARHALRPGRVRARPGGHPARWPRACAGSARWRPGRTALAHRPPGRGAAHPARRLESRAGPARSPGQRRERIRAPRGGRRRPDRRADGRAHDVLRRARPTLHRARAPAVAGGPCRGQVWSASRWSARPRPSWRCWAS